MYLKTGRGMVIVLAFLLLLGVVYYAVHSSSGLRSGKSPSSPSQQLEEARYQIIDEDRGEVLESVPRRVHVGDEWITSDERGFVTYRVVRVKGKRAYARVVEPAP